MSQKRFIVVTTARTTGADLMYTWSDVPAEALKLAKGAEQTGARNVRVLDAADSKHYDLATFAKLHKLA